MPAAGAISALETSTTVGVQVSAQAQQTGGFRRAGVRGDLTITGAIICSGLASPTGNVTLLGDLCNRGEMTTKQAVTSHLKTQSMEADSIMTARGTVSVKGKIQVSGTVAGLMNSTCDNIQVAETSQWAMAFLETFEDNAAGWSKPVTSQCNGNTILGGHCNLANGEVTKTFTNLPPHDQLRLGASFLFLDGWTGENAYAKIDDSFIWLDNYDHGDGKSGVNVCGAATPEKRLATPIDGVVAHTADSVTVTFGSDTQKHACDASWGVDNVMVQTR